MLRLREMTRETVTPYDLRTADPVAWKARIKALTVKHESCKQRGGRPCRRVCVLRLGETRPTVYPSLNDAARAMDAPRSTISKMIAYQSRGRQRFRVWWADNPNPDFRMVEGEHEQTGEHRVFVDVDHAAEVIGCCVSMVKETAGGTYWAAKGWVLLYKDVVL
jgi:hypothetical protein